METISDAHLIDCMEYMRTIPDKFFDLAIPDVNYGIKQDGRKNHTRSKRAKAKDYQDYSRYDNQPPPVEYFTELFRISKHQIIWGANHFISRMPYDASCWIVWDKDNGNNDFADCELAWTSFPRAVRKFKFRWQGMLQEDMYNKEKRIHPNQKPVALYKWCFEKFTNAGDKVFDSHMGSQNSRIAASIMNLNYWGCENDEKHYNNGCNNYELNKGIKELF